MTKNRYVVRGRRGYITNTFGYYIFTRKTNRNESAHLGALPWSFAVRLAAFWEAYAKAHPDRCGDTKPVAGSQ